ncbi:IS6 family insertion sequence transposase domain-containing protein (plasmid) [Rhizobium etli]|uniref:IS6 family insertion sequence transposase domain-containing protein n=1 Tax=Rhizobium etli TaxID=29449 RepID=A0AAN1BLN0_RHIET|nr:IS6 family insertion sequence transposase domain-containing protein [Rhizobium sp. NXC14]ARQ13449.1 IS6 family insertion sequence transposase domain-containing protein [Rhizobium etli]
MTDRDPLYRRHCFPAEVIAHAVWLYFRFPLSLQVVEDLLAARRIVDHPVGLGTSGISMKPLFQSAARSIGWRAVDHDGFVLEVLVQSRRNAKAANRLMGQGRSPRAMITDKLQSYGAAKREIMRVEHRSHKGMNNRAENSHQPVRRRERIMKRFKSQPHLQRFVSIMIRSPTDFKSRATTSPRPPTRTAHGGDEPVGKNCPIMRDICGWRLSLAFHPFTMPGWERHDDRGSPSSDAT